MNVGESRAQLRSDKFAPLINSGRFDRVGSVEFSNSPGNVPHDGVGLINLSILSIEQRKLYSEMLLLEFSSLQMLKSSPVNLYL